MKKKWSLFGACYLILAAAFGVGLGSINLPRYFRLAQNGEVVVGFITATDCENHSLASYKFRVGDQEYFGKATMGADCKNVGPGSPVDVSYVRDDPTINTLSSRPSGRFVNEIVSVACPAIFVPAVIIGLAAAAGRVRAKRQSGSR